MTKLLLPEREAIALTCYGEARGGSEEGRIAVACVLQNRHRSGRWGPTFAQVALAPFQFSCWNKKDPNRALLLRLLATGADSPPPVLRECYAIADGILGNVITPRVGTCMHYHAAAMPVPPRWARGVLPFTEISGHLFYEDIA